MPQPLSNIIRDMGKVRLLLGMLLLMAGLSVTVLTLGSYITPSACYEVLSGLIGAKVRIEGDGLLALGLLLVWQGFSLLRRHKSVLCTLFPVVPFLLILSLLSDDKGIVPAFLSGLAGGDGILLVLSLLSVALSFALALVPPPGKKEPRPLPDVPEVIEEDPVMREPPPTGTSLPREVVDEVISKVLRPSKDDGTYKALQRKRKELMRLSREDRQPFSDSHLQYRDRDGKELSVTDALSLMVPFVFSVSFETVNSKGLRKTVEAESMTVPAFTPEEAKALAMREIKSYSKGGYVYTKTIRALEAVHPKDSLSYDDFLLPWASASLRYDDDSTLFAFDFYLKYAKDRRLERIE